MQRYIKLAVMFSIIFVFVLFKTSSLAGADSNGLQEVKLNASLYNELNVDSVIHALRVKNNLWYKLWIKTEEIPSASFKLVNHYPLVINESFKYKEDPILLQNGFLRFSPDSSMFVDVYSSSLFLETKGNSIYATNEIDSKAVLVNRTINVAQVLYTIGSIGGIDDAFWLDESKIVILGYEQDVKTSGYCSCILVIDLENKGIDHLIGPSDKIFHDYFSVKYPFVKFE